MKKVIYFILGIIALLAMFTRDIEMIPDDAKVYVFPNKQIWVPDNPDGNIVFNLEYHPDADSFFSYADNAVESTYSQVKEGKYSGYALPKELGAKQNYMTGYNINSLMGFIFGKENRWNEDGSWNY